MVGTAGITELLLECRADGSAAERVFPLIYEELRRVTHQHLRGERPGHTLGTTERNH